jgi:hypothetical protein
MGAFEERMHEHLANEEGYSSTEQKEYDYHYRKRVNLRQLISIHDFPEITDSKTLHNLLAEVNDELRSPGLKKLSPNMREIVESELSLRKRAILARIWEVKNQEKINSLREAVERIPGEEDRERVSAELDALQRSANSLVEQNQQVLSDQHSRDRDLVLLKQDIAERKWRNIRSQILARDSIATLIGSLLLIGLGTVIVVAMFMKVEVSELITNSFLIVLGYFFGQSGDRSRRGE